MSHLAELTLDCLATGGAIESIAWRLEKDETRLRELPAPTDVGPWWTGSVGAARTSSRGRWARAAG